MPAYEYFNAKHGVHVTIVSSVADRPARVILRRREIPSRVSICTGAKEPTHSDQLAAGYKKLEELGQLRKTNRPGQLTNKQIKNALAAPEAP